MHVFLIAAVSADGFIDRGSHQASTEWTSAEDKKFFRDRTKEAGVMVVGRTTFETIGRALPGRKIYVLSSQSKPEKFSEIPDSQVEYTSLTPAELLSQLETTALMDADGTTKKIKEVAVCGGSSIYTQFIQAGLIDTLYLTMEPVVFGEGIKLFNGSISPKLSLKSVTNLSEQTLLLEYSVQR
jgi:dihydrofolate reductase